jgi:hypothetical protein
MPYEIVLAITVLIVHIRDMKTRFGKIKVYAHRLLNGEAIPFFNDKKLNRMIDAHYARIIKTKTKKNN